MGRAKRSPCRPAVSLCWGVERACLLIFACLLLTAHAQRDTDFHFGTRVRCHTCDADFTIEKFSVDHPCLLGQRERDVAYCSVNSNFCKVEVTRLNGVLVSFSRRCADKCSPNCYEKGYGMLTELCTYCCRRNQACGEKRKP